MRKFWFMLLLAPLTGCPGSGQNAAGNTSGTAAPPFLEDTAFAYLVKQVEFGPRVPGSPGHQAQLAWMTEFLRERADTLILQPFTHEHTRDRKTLRLTNLLARFNPGADTRILLLAHWDTRPTADNEDDDAARDQPILGANDGASGTAVLLELANVLKRHSPPIGVDLLFVDGEDYGPDSANMYLGAAYFAANPPAGYPPLYGILLDMIGDQNPVYPIEGNSQDMAPEVVDRVYRTAEQIGLGTFFPRRPGTYITDDHLQLNRAGIRTIDIIDFDYGPGNAYWHSTQDVVANTSPRGLGAVGRVLAELIFRGG
ncbi:MAG TPA: M28 family peptidase [Longimicrobiales bacterium]|nr:M28 family peptidase [Longimicrobiales bacterium]